MTNNPIFRTPALIIIRCETDVSGAKSLKWYPDCVQVERGGYLGVTAIETRGARVNLSQFKKDIAGENNFEFEVLEFTQGGNITWIRFKLLGGEKKGQVDFSFGDCDGDIGSEKGRGPLAGPNMILKSTV